MVVVGLFLDLDLDLYLDADARSNTRYSQRFSAVCGVCCLLCAVWCVGAVGVWGGDLELCLRPHVEGYGRAVHYSQKVL